MNAKEYESSGHYVFYNAELDQFLFTINTSEVWVTDLHKCSVYHLPNNNNFDFAVNDLIINISLNSAYGKDRNNDDSLSKAVDAGVVFLVPLSKVLVKAIDRELDYANGVLAESL